MSSGHEMSNTGMLFIDAHGLKIQGGYLKFLPKPLGGGHGFQEKFLGGSTYFVFYNFYCIFINKFFENLPGGGAVSYPPPPYTPPPPVCIYYVIIKCIVCLVSLKQTKLN
jgi:hypothetical protein